MSGGNQQSNTSPGVGGQTPTSSAGLMALIADVERQLASLREADESRRGAEEALRAREAEIAERERAAGEAAARAEAMTRELEAQRSEFESRQRETLALKEEMDRARRDIESHRAELDRELERISALERAAKETQRESSERVAGAERAAAEAEQRRAQMERTLAERGAAFRAAEERMEQRATEMSQLLDAGQRQAATHEARATELAGQIEGMRAQIETLRVQARDSGEADGLRKQVAERDRAMERLRADLGAATALAEETRRAAETAGAEVTRLTGEAAEQARVVASRNEELKGLRAQVASLKERSGVDASGRAQLAEAQSLLAEREARLAEQQSQLEALRSGAAAGEAALKGAERKNAEYLAHIAHVEAELASAQEAGERGAAATSSKMEAKLRAATEAEARARAEAEKLRAFARTLGEELAEARRAGAGAPAAQADELVSLRRERLRRQRKLLRAQVDKVKRAGDAISDRFQQVEQILAQRAEIISAKKLVDESKRKLRSRQARAGAVAAVFYVALSLLIFSGLGWLAAQKVAPAVYAVSSRIAADASGRPLSPAEMDEWKHYHEELVADPRLLEVVADRMKQRGIASLGSAPALKIRLDADFSCMSREPGTLDLELRGLGAGSTARELDTLVTTLVRQANSARERRVDGSTTIIASEATPAEYPLHDERIVYAAGIAGALTLISTIAAWVLWRKLYEAKASVERNDEFDGIMDDRRWKAPARPGS